MKTNEQQLTPEEKQSELDRYRDLVLATLNYLRKQYAGSIVLDQVDLIADYYKQQEFQTEEYHKQRKLDRLQQSLTSLTKGLQNRGDLNFAGYIKEKTGYDIDIFEDLQKRIDAIIARKEIRNQEELNDIGTMLNLCQQRSADRDLVDKLKALAIDYSKLTAEPTTPGTSRKRKTEYSEVISRVEKDGIVEETVRISTGPRPKHLEEKVVKSPDGNRSLRVTQWSGGKHASTSVVIEFLTASSVVYATDGIHPDVKVLWKDNSTIVIETKKDYTTIVQHREARSFDDVIAIEYIVH